MIASIKLKALYPFKIPSIWSRLWTEIAALFGVLDRNSAVKEHPYLHCYNEQWSDASSAADVGSMANSMELCQPSEATPTPTRARPSSDPSAQAPGNTLGSAFEPYRSGCPPMPDDWQSRDNHQDMLYSGYDSMPAYRGPDDFSPYFPCHRSSPLLLGQPNECHVVIHPFTGSVYGGGEA